VRIPVWRRFWPLAALPATLILGLALRAWILESSREPPDYSRIAADLYVGARLKQPPPGTTAVLNLCEFDDPYTVAAYSWQPIRDAEPAPGIDWLRRQVDWITQQREAGHTVFVHCQNGVSRSGLVVVALFMHTGGLTRDEALSFVRSRRPGVRPHPAFMELLGQWEQALAQANR